MFSSSEEEEEEIKKEEWEEEGSGSLIEESKRGKKMDPARVGKVVKGSMIIEDYKYDPRNDKWCAVEIKVRYVVILYN